MCLSLSRFVGGGSLKLLNCSAERGLNEERVGLGGLTASSALLKIPIHPQRACLQLLTLLLASRDTFPPKSQTVRHLITYFSAFINSLSV